ncbi:hypothetical protein ACHAWT_003466 [Skeletonema menzelii]
MKQTEDLAEAEVLPIPTFHGNSLLDLEEAGISTEEQDHHEDAFLFYSDDEVRMRVLSGGTRGADHHHQSTVTDGVVTRKTRISFELHPSVFFDDLLSDEDFIGNDFTEEAVMEAARNNPKVASVASILAAFLFEGDGQADIRTSRAA